MSSRNAAKPSILSSLLFGVRKSTSGGRIVRFDKNGESDTVSPTIIRKLIIDCLSDSKEPITAKQISEQTHVKTTALLRVLRLLTQEEIVGRLSRGSKSPVFYLINYIRSTP